MWGGEAQLSCGQKSQGKRDGQIALGGRIPLYTGKEGIKNPPHVCFHMKSGPMSQQRECLSLCGNSIGKKKEETMDEKKGGTMGRRKNRLTEIEQRARKISFIYGEDPLGSYQGKFTGKGGIPGDIQCNRQGHQQGSNQSISLKGVLSIAFGKV